MVIISVIVAVILFVIGVPLYICFGAAGLLIVVFHAGFSIQQLASIFFGSMDSFMLVAAPLFILAGNLMVVGGLGKALVNFINSFMGRISGGLAISAIITSMLVGSLTGMVAACLATVGLVLFPAMREAGYDDGYSAGLLCISSFLGKLLPPSLIFILYGVLTSTSIPDLFLAGIVPAFIFAPMLIAIAMILARRRKYPKAAYYTWKQRTDLFVQGIPAIIMPFIILGGIYGGIFTPTEAAAVSCVYCIFAGAVIYRQLTLKNFWKAVSDTVRLTCMILIMLGGSILLGKAATLTGFAQTITEWVVNIGVGPTGFLILLVIMWSLVSFVMDDTAIMFIIIPIILPTIINLNINLIHLGVIFVLTAMIGGLSPPVAAQLYTASALFKIPPQVVMKGVLPFLGVMCILLLIVIWFPELTTWLPSLAQQLQK